MDKLDEVYKNLTSGKLYAEWLENVRFPCYMHVLSYDRAKRLFRWTHFGSSANKATKRDLAWIIEVIFKMTPEEFCERYPCVDRETYNKI